MSDRIVDGWYVVAMFPAWLTEDHRYKAVRLLGVLAAFPIFILLSPITAIVIMFSVMLMVWEDL